ncbi:hypothetical protein PpBr36_07596 [Pyricularia pennisetigena]|uniref:hypothetical protein n=1 Tax=Pyricularia pennisetigena TaxID=1578925 RepID=UPI00114D87AF|nr:hypothetical protein PpBr36_07596 [Pyricularia pennisetigena]TLS25290.1 hypothetical protein PpBr36_07596 [Pyricularia pennisetigena]
MQTTAILALVAAGFVAASPQHKISKPVITARQNNGQATPVTATAIATISTVATAANQVITASTTVFATATPETTTVTVTATQTVSETPIPTVTVTAHWGHHHHGGHHHHHDDDYDDDDYDDDDDYGKQNCAYRDAQGARTVDTPCTSCSQRGRPGERKDSFHPFRSLGSRTPTP